MWRAVLVAGGLGPTLLACSSPPPSPERLVAVVATADSLHLAGNFDSARVLWAELVQTAQRDHLRDMEARGLTGLGLADYRTGDYPSARRHLAAALAVQRASGLDSQLARTHNALGLVAYQQGRLVESAAHYDSSLSAARQRDDLPGVGRALGNLGLVRFELGDFAGARDGFEAMRAAGASLDDARIQGNALNNLGMLEVRLGNAGAALRPLDEAGRLYRRIDYRTGEQNNLGQRATVYAAIGDLGRAFAVLDSALVMCRELGLRQEEASNLEVLASLHQGAGDWNRALRLYAEAQKINVELELALEQGTNARSRAVLLRDLGRVDAAVRLADSALGVHRAAGARQEELHDLLLLAELAQARADGAAEQRWIGAADRVADSLRAAGPRAHVTLTRARLHDRTRDAAGVLAALAEGPRLWEAAGYAGVTEGFALRARAHARLGQLDSAISEGRNALAAGQRLRSALGSTELRVRSASLFAEAHADLIGALVRRGRVAEAFEAADGERGRTLLEHLESGSAAPLDARDAATVRREALLRELSELAARRSRLAAEEADSLVTLRIEERIEKARAEFEALLARSRSAPPALVGAARASASAVQSSLATDEVLVEYLVAPDRVHIFVVTRDQIRHTEQPIEVGALARRVRLAHDMLAGPAAPNATAVHAVLGALHESLVAPIAQWMPAGSRLILVTHGVLSRVPFSALRTSRGRWLVESHPIVHVPSGAALQILRGRAIAAQATELRVFAPLPQALPGTAREATAVGASWSGARTYVGSAASETQLRAALTSPGLVHVATHGRLNERNPMFSWIELFAPPGDSPENDGRLEVHEVFGRKLAANLVFLSGCETGAAVAINPYQGGEEYAALAQVLLHAGIRNVIATAWRIEDGAAAEFAKRFYANLAGRSPGDALAAAQREFLRSTALAHPRHWAGYQTSGDGRIVGAHTTEVASVQ